jgi:hypothetical protein
MYRQAGRETQQQARRRFPSSETIWIRLGDKMNLQFVIARKSVVTAKAENCGCRVTATAYSGRDDSRAAVVRCTGRHSHVVKELQAAAEAEAKRELAVTK